MIRALDHMVILVNNLTLASAHYTRLGFTVTPGGKHADGATHNALVVFPDNTYLELLAFLRPTPEHRWWHHAAHGEGLIDFALLPDAIDQDVADARDRGLALAGPIAGGRLRPDGQRVAWQSALPDTPDLPFLCGDVTPRTLRVPEGSARRHTNGATGIAAVVVAVADLAASAARYRALLGGDATGPTFELGGATITLADASTKAARTRLERRGEGLLALTLRAGPASGAGRLDPSRTHGAPIDLDISLP